MNQEYDEALIRGNTEALGRIYADEFACASTGSDVLNKAQQIELLKAGAMEIESGASEGVEVRVHGDIGVVWDDLQRRGLLRGSSFDEPKRLISVWVKWGGRWKLVAEQGTLVPSNEGRVLRPRPQTANPTRSVTSLNYSFRPEPKARCTSG